MSINDVRIVIEIGTNLAEVLRKIIDELPLPNSTAGLNTDYVSVISEIRKLIVESIKEIALKQKTK